MRFMDNPLSKLITLVTMSAVASIGFSGCGASQAESRDPIRVMLLTGQMNKYHSWEICSSILHRHLEDAGIFEVEKVITPPQGEDMSGFSPNWLDYDVIVMDYDGDEWTDATKKSFVEYIAGGGGLVTVHSTDNAFPKWQEWLEMTGLGGWGGRDETWGPKVRWRDGKMVFDDGPGRAGHPPNHDFLITVRDPEHPVTEGMPSSWLHAHDELYSQLRGPAKNMHILATGKAEEGMKGDTGENEPVLFTISYGEGRVFHTTLGHVGKQEAKPVRSVQCVGFSSSLQRGVEWAATGKVSLPVPSDFPTEAQTSVREIELK